METSQKSNAATETFGAQDSALAGPSNLPVPSQIGAKDPEEPNQSEGPAKERAIELMQCLSKEIETTTTNMMAFRTRIGFGMFVGPFVLLGSIIVAAKGQAVSFQPNWYVWAALGVDVICFLGIAYIASQIEAQAIKQCNKWRGLIADLSEGPSKGIDKTKLEANLRWGRWPGVETAYLVGYFLLFLSVVAAVVIMLKGVSPAH
jgi:hypothetical protein